MTNLRDQFYALRDMVGAFDFAHRFIESPKEGAYYPRQSVLHGFDLSNGIYLAWWTDYIDRIWLRIVMTDEYVTGPLAKYESAARINNAQSKVFCNRRFIVQNLIPESFRHGIIESSYKDELLLGHAADWLLENNMDNHLLMPARFLAR